MAGAFTHIMVCLKALSDHAQPALDEELWRLLNKHSEFLCLGSVSPDLPYLSLKTGKINWADVMHHEETNSIAVSGHAALKKIWPIKSEADEVKLVWLFGFISHLVADATIHPIVQAIVGPYSVPENQEPHRICEMTQDSLIFQEVQKGDIRASRFVDILKSCSSSVHLSALMNFWERQLRKNYADKKERPKTSFWYSTYKQALDVSDGDSFIVQLSRHIQTIDGYVYKTREEILTECPDRFEKYYSKISLPSGKTGDFKKDGFEKAIINVLTVWNELYRGFASEIIVSDCVKNWSLDTGVDQNSSKGEVTYYA